MAGIVLKNAQGSSEEGSSEDQGSSEEGSSEDHGEDHGKAAALSSVVLQPHLVQVSDR